MGLGDAKSPSTDADAFDNPIASFEDEGGGEGTTFDGDASADAVLPESLDAQEGSQQTEMWKESLVQHATDRKENMRDRVRRETRSKLEDSSILDPDDKFRRWWDVAQMLLLTYVAFVVPYRLGFSHPVLLWSAWFWFDLCCDIYFITDIVISCITAYYTDTGVLIVDPKLIRRNYARTWALIDISACFPGNYISYALDEGGNSSSRSIKLLRMLRLLKLLRLARINRLIQKYEEEFAAVMTTLKLTKLVAIIIVVGHWLSCLLFFFGAVDYGDPTADTGLDANGEKNVGWVSRHFGEDFCGPDECRWQKYVTSFYWAVMTMTTVGYGDIVPHTKYEMYASVVAMTVGGFVFGMIVGNLAELSKRANAGELMRQDAVSRMQMILDAGIAKGSLPKELARSIKSHYSYVLDRKTSLDVNQFVLSLPPDLRDQMAESMHWIDGVADGHEVFGLLHKIPFFMGLSNEACIHICAKMKCLMLSPLPGQRELVMEEGTRSEEMYVIIEGVRSIVVEGSGVQLGLLSTGDFFGELGALLPPTMAALSLRRRSAYAVITTQLGMITHRDLMQFRKEYMEINEKVVDYANQIVGHLRPPSTPDAATDTKTESEPVTIEFSVLDAHPELRALERKMEMYMLGKAQKEATK